MLGVIGCSSVLADKWVIKVLNAFQVRAPNQKQVCSSGAVRLML